MNKSGGPAFTAMLTTYPDLAFTFTVGAVSGTVRGADNTSVGGSFIEFDPSGPIVTALDGLNQGDAFTVEVTT